MCLPAARPRLADLTGIFLSLTCLIHCLALPLAILLAPALSRWISLPEFVHAATLLLALTAATVAMRSERPLRLRTVPAILAARDSTRLNSLDSCASRIPYIAGTKNHTLI